MYCDVSSVAWLALACLIFRLLCSCVCVCVFVSESQVLCRIPQYFPFLVVFLGMIVSAGDALGGEAAERGK